MNDLHLRFFSSHEPTGLPHMWHSNTHTSCCKQTSRLTHTHTNELLLFTSVSLLGFGWHNKHQWQYLSAVILLLKRQSLKKKNTLHSYDTVILMSSLQKRSKLTQLKPDIPILFYSFHPSMHPNQVPMLHTMQLDSWQFSPDFVASSG